MFIHTRCELSGLKQPSLSSWLLYYTDVTSKFDQISTTGVVLTVLTFEIIFKKANLKLGNINYSNSYFTTSQCFFDNRTSLISGGHHCLSFCCLHKTLRISCKDHVTNEEVCAKIQQAIRPQEDLIIVKRCKLQWYGHVSCSSGLARTNL